MSTPDPLELLPRPWRIVREMGRDVIRCATGASVFWHPSVWAHMVEAVNAYADTGQAPEPVMTETVRAVVRRLSRTRREFAEAMPCTWCNNIGVVPGEAFGRDEDGAPMVDGVQPCPEGCEVPRWLQAERNDARDDAAELDRLSAAVAELERQLEWSRWAASAAQRGERELIQQRAAGLALAAAAEEQRDAEAGEQALVPAAALRRALLGTDTPEGKR